MTTITKERLLTIKQWRETYGPGSNVVLPAEEAEELARIVLASLEAEPVLYQSCTRPTWNSGVPWTEWKERSREGYEDDLRFTDTPDHAGWINKCRKLYTTPPAPIALEAIENAIEYIRSIAFHIDEDDYHGKHIAYFMRQALAWLEGHSCSDDRLGKADNQPVRGNQAAESNRGNEWTGNPDIDNAIIMLDRIDTAESYDDDRIEAVKAVLRRLAGNSPVTPDGWISCSERMPPQDDWILIYSKHGEYMAGQVQGEYVELSDGTLSWLGNALFWMPLPEPPQEAK
ncbi:putative bacteriophage protein [Escherichia coli M056]|nr:putative bacteriophage protein [Escherichia coli M056]